MPESESRKSKDGLAGWLFATQDPDWQQKWQTPPGTVPRFDEAGAVQRGAAVFVLTLFMNPMRTADGRASIVCDMRVQRPDGTLWVDAKDQICCDGPIHPGDRMLFLSESVATIICRSTEPPGRYEIQVVLKDRLGGTILPLQTSFILQ